MTSEQADQILERITNCARTANAQLGANRVVDAVAVHLTVRPELCLLVGRELF